jgi:hypothetical protein
MPRPKTDKPPMPSGRGRKKADHRPSHYFRQYRQLLGYFQTHKNWSDGTDQEINHRLRRILDGLGEDGKKRKSISR